VVLLPGSDGTTGAVIVRQGGSEARIDQAYGSARAGAAGTLEVTQAGAAQVRAEFADALNAMPAAPLSFTVYFVFGQDELTEESCNRARTWVRCSTTSRAGPHPKSR
jgi:hypothetical protein